jgi:heat shock protein HslJ
MMVLIACQWGSSDNLAGSAWHLTMLNGHAPLNMAEPISLSFEAEQRAGGNSGCNSYGGSYMVAGSTLTISEINSTLRACAEQALNDQEAEYYQALQAVAAYEHSNDQLILKDARGVVLLIFIRA